MRAIGFGLTSMRKSWWISYAVVVHREYGALPIKNTKNKVEILLPDAIIGNDEKDVVVLVIGEFDAVIISLYGYENPQTLLEGDSVYVSDATPCTTYTTGSLKCILEHEDTGNYMKFAQLFVP